MLWGLLVLVQISAVLLLDFTSLITTSIITGIGTMLTLYLGLQVDRKRFKREEYNKKQEQIARAREAMLANTCYTINDARLDLPIYEPLFPDSDLFDYEDTHSMPYNVIPFPQPSAHFVVDDLGMGESDGLMPQNWEAIADADESKIVPEITSSSYAICKHCYRQIKGKLHTEGMHQGKMRCDPEDTLGGYGYNAEPTDAECGKTCLGHKK